MKRILFICTGNTCRSPMAEFLTRKLLQEQGRSDIEVSSAGTAAFPGDAMSRFALGEMEDRGIDASMHRSRPVNAQMLEESDLVITMTAAQKAALAPFCSAEKLFSFGELAGFDIHDPYGCDADAYARCAVQIEAAVAQLVAQLPPAE